MKQTISSVTTSVVEDEYITCSETTIIFLKSGWVGKCACKSKGSGVEHPAPKNKTAK